MGFSCHSLYAIDAAIPVAQLTCAHAVSLSRLTTHDRRVGSGRAHTVHRIHHPGEGLGEVRGEALGRGLLLPDEGMGGEGLLEPAEDEALALLVRLCAGRGVLWWWWAQRCRISGVLVWVHADKQAWPDHTCHEVHLACMQWKAECLPHALA